MNVRMRAVSRAVLAGCFALAVSASAALTAPALADSGSATGPAEVTVVPPEDPTAPATDRTLAAGSTGFVHQREGVDGALWTDYVTGATHALPALAGVSAGRVRPAGGDAFAVTDSGTNGLKVGRPDRDTLVSYAIPDGFYVRGVASNGTRALVAKPVTESEPQQVVILGLGADGGVTTVPLTGLPDGAQLAVVSQGNATDNAHHAIIDYRTGPTASSQYALVDLDTGAATPVPGMTASLRVFLTPSDVAWGTPRNGSITVSMLPQSAVLDGSAATMTPATLTFTTAESGTVVPVGGHLLTASTSAAPGAPTSAPFALLDRPFDGGDPTTVLAAAVTAPAVAPDGSVLITGGADTTTSAVHRYTPAADGPPTATTVLPLPPLKTGNAGLSLAHGFLRHVTSLPVTDAQPRLTVHNHPVAADSDATSGPPFGRADFPANLPATTLPCAAGASCVRTVDGTWNGTSFLMAASDGSTQIRSVVDGATSTLTVTLPFTGGRLVDASLHYQLVDSATTQYAVEPGTHRVVASGPITGAALWGNTLWQAPVDETPGTLTATDLGALPSPKVYRMAWTGASCRPTELQASQHWLYWSCGASGPAGVYDLDRSAGTTVPAGQALLGDGYLVRHVAGQLLMTDFHTGTAAAPQVLADVPDSPLADDRGITFAVDRYSGGVAYAAADRSVHVLTTGVPASTPAGTVSSTGTVSPRDAAPTPWTADFTLDRPVDSWQLTIGNAATGATAAVVTGGPSRELVHVQWDGRLIDGSAATSGTYVFQLSATADGSTSVVQGTSGRLAVMCGALPYRSYDCNGDQALLGVLTASGLDEGHWWHATTEGRLADGGYTEAWDLGTETWQTSALVPFGDINGDLKGDLLARDGSGVLTAYLGFGQAYFNPDEPMVKKVRIGAGWNIYNLIQSPGDLNQDGRADLIARDASGALWFYAGTGKSSFSARVQIGPGWQSYTQIVAVGDLNGDGRGDLVAVDRQGLMWRYYGNTHGGFLPRAQIGTGWNAYRTLIGIGDLSHDGHNDLVALDPAGGLWRYDGRPDATFRPRVQIGIGFSSYHLF